MRGYLLSFLSLWGVVLFSCCLFLSSNLSFFWLYLELSTLCVVPSFFIHRGGSTLGSLFSYLIVSSVSSSLVVCGLLCEDLLLLLVLGLLVKFGLFPFFGWVYVVVIHSNWGVVWAISTFLKISFFFLPFFLSGGEAPFVYLLGVVTLLLLSVLFWLYSFSWFSCWCHMMLSSSVVFVCAALCCSSDVLVWLFSVYICWASLVIFFLGYQGEMGLVGWLGCFFFVVLLVSVPCSLSIFYKLMMGFCVFSCGLPVFLSWIFYSVSEQFFLLKYLIGSGIPSGAVGLSRLV